MPPASDPEEQIEGVIERISFHAPDTGWTVARILSETRVTPVVGVMLEPETGESVRLFGTWTQHPQYGRQFRFERYQLIRPQTAGAIEAYLSGGLVEGIGPVMAKRLVEHFGERTLDILDKKPDRVMEVRGIGESRAAALRQAWRKHQSVHRIIVFLMEHGIGPSLSGRIHAAYGDRSIEVIEREPYRLARDIYGISFLTADRIARSAGISPEDPARIEAGLLHVLSSAYDQGHLYQPLDLLMQRAEELLGVARELIDSGLDRLLTGGDVVREQLGDEVGIYPRAAFETEREVALRLIELAAGERPGAPPLEGLIQWLGRREAMGETALTREQAEAVCAALRHGVTVITGGPGTGKTTVTRALVDACASLGKSVALASPTGRAAKRLEQLSGRPASTVHRLLAYDPQKHGFRHDADNPLPADLVILDEASMLDIGITRDVLRALKPLAQLVLVGDADQLPSVGPGSVLRDIVASKEVPVHRLTQVFRQAAGSDIIESAHRLNQGLSPKFPRHEEWLERRGDCIWLEEDDAEQAAMRTVRAATSNLPKMGFSVRDVQVITPLHRGVIGAQALNAELQQAINPPSPGRREVKRGEVVFREGDRVLQTRNNYDKDIYNGDIGFINGVDPETRNVSVEFDTGTVRYEPSELDELALAYALTVHKSQGSEYPAVVMVIHSSHYIMLQRNLLYTALTRAKSMACIVGDQRGIWRAIKNVSERDRFTRLWARLRGEV